MGHNSCKNEFIVISTVCTYSTLYSKKIYFEFQIYMLSNGRAMKKCHTFSSKMTTTMTGL